MKFAEFLHPTFSSHLAEMQKFCIIQLLWKMYRIYQKVRFTEFLHQTFSSYAEILHRSFALDKLYWNLSAACSPVAKNTFSLLQLFSPFFVSMCYP